MAQPRNTARRMQAARDAGLRRLSGATVALTLTSLAGVGVVAAVVKSATEHSASRSAPTSNQISGSDGSQQSGTGGGGTGSDFGSSGSGSAGSNSADPGNSGVLPDQSSSGQIQPPAYDPAPAPSHQPHASSGGS